MLDVTFFKKKVTKRLTLFYLILDSWVPGYHTHLFWFLSLMQSLIHMIGTAASMADSYFPNDKPLYVFIY
jgi:hypothetical protein